MFSTAVYVVWNRHDKERVSYEMGWPTTMFLIMTVCFMDDRTVTTSTAVQARWVQSDLERTVMKTVKWAPKEA